MTPLIKIDGARWTQFVVLQAAGLYFSKKLKGFQRKRVRVHVVLERGLKTREKCRGMAHQNSKRGYIIKLEPTLKSLAMLRCFAHEMIHVNQWLTGKMVDMNGWRSQVRWGSKVYNMPMRYSKHPWEKEAYRQDWRLAQSFIDFYTSGWRKQ